MMFAVLPVDVVANEALLVASSFAEDEYPLWNSATTYAAGARVIRTTTHRTYESAAGSNLNRIPENNTPTWWLEVEATHKWKAFDRRLMMRAGATSNVWWRIAPLTRCNFVGIFGIFGDTASALLQDSSNNLLSSHVINLGATYASGAPDWTNSYNIIRIKDYAAWLDFPLLANQRVQVGVNAASGLRWASEVVVGNAIPIGIAGAGSGVGYTDYSTKTRDFYGNVVKVGRPAGDHAIFNVRCLSADVAGHLGVLRTLRARPAVYFTKAHETYETMIFGWAKDPLIVHDDGVNATYTLEVEGAT